jgi:hypothetical protein
MGRGRERERVRTQTVVGWYIQSDEGQNHQPRITAKKGMRNRGI